MEKKKSIIYERVIPLGSNCSTKGHINAFFKKEIENAMKTLPGHAELFDWVEIHDYKCLIECLNNNFDNFFEREDMQLNFKTPNELYNKKTKIRYPHLFHQIYDGDEISSKFTDKFVDSVFPKLKTKIDYLKDKFISAKNYNTLYVIACKRHRMDINTMTELRNSILNIRDGDVRFNILFVPQRKTFSEIDHVTIRDCKVHNQIWINSDHQINWDEILSEFSFAEILYLPKNI
jgi:hypothetical protein